MNQINANERQEFLRYESFLNKVVGVLAFSFGLQCLGFDDLPYFLTFSKKQFFAIISMIFIGVILCQKQEKIRDLLKKMVETKHPFFDFSGFIYRNLSYVIALTFLFLIAFGKIK